ncbi:MAG: DNA-3-methyladenine glycosylase I [Candidatus Heimdallarchaeota archaeon]|nr:DNA-3-methyladenine glycosylase I [Candidatus Heimdallarchaeota archaeon]
MKRCAWAGSNPLMVEYHDKEWGNPLYDDTKLFEFLCLEGAQAGLSWSTILNKRERFIKVFDGFDPKKVAGYDEKKVDQLLQDPGIIRHRGKIEAIISNARLVIEVTKEFGSFSNYIWQFVGEPIINQYKTIKEIPASTDLSKHISKEMKKRGFKFVGPTIVYAFMQAVGMVNDHETTCFRYKQVS